MPHILPHVYFVSSLRMPSRKPAVLTGSVRSASASAHFDQRSIASDEERGGFARKPGLHDVEVSSDVHRVSQRRSFIEQPINFGVFELLPAFLLFALDLQLVQLSSLS
jgi:hypothetical protein